MLIKYRATIQLGWDKSYYRTFMSQEKAESWLDRMKAKYQPGQVIDRRVVIVKEGA